MPGPKAPSAFLTIGEVAERLNVPIHTIRFWEARIGELRPMRSGRGQRRYRPEDVDLLMGVRFLLDERGLNLRGVQKILRERGLNHVRACWREAA